MLRDQTPSMDLMMLLLFRVNVVLRKKSSNQKINKGYASNYATCTTWLNGYLGIEEKILDIWYDQERLHQAWRAWRWASGPWCCPATTPECFFHWNMLKYHDPCSSFFKSYWNILKPCQNPWSSCFKRISLKSKLSHSQFLWWESKHSCRLPQVLHKGSYLCLRKHQIRHS